MDQCNLKLWGKGIREKNIRKTLFYCINFILPSAESDMSVIPSSTMESFFSGPLNMRHSSTDASSSLVVYDMLSKPIVRPEVLLHNNT